MRIQLPGLLLVLVGIAGIIFLGTTQDDWRWPEMCVLAAVTGVGAVRAMRGA